MAENSIQIAQIPNLETIIELKLNMTELYEFLQNVQLKIVSLEKEILELKGKSK